MRELIVRERLFSNFFFFFGKQLDDARKISRLDVSGLNDLEGLKKGKQRIKGDQNIRRGANPKSCPRPK